MTDTVREIIAKWKQGCSNGPAGECASCSAGALSAIEHALDDREISFAEYWDVMNRPMIFTLGESDGDGAKP